MKTRKYVSVLIPILAVLIFTGGCATDKMTYKSKDYEIYGTWVNPNAKPVIQFGKMVFNIDGVSESYNTIESTTSMNKKFVITNKWVESKGVIIYTLIFDMGTEIELIYGLAKISDSGKTLELSISKSDYPKEIDPKYTEYFIGYRQE